MMRYVALFDSFSEGGNRLTMADLRYALEREEFEDVETVVASGNVLFSFEERPTDGLEDLFATMMLDRFDMSGFVAVRTQEEVRAAIEGNPFHANGADDLVHTHFLAGQPTPEQFESLLANYAGRGRERLALGDRALFIDFVDGVAASKLSGLFMARRLGCAGTARNMTSLKRILEKMGQPA